MVASTRAALDYLAKLLQDFDGDHLLAVAAYNWGEGNVMRAMSRNRSRGKPTDVWSLRLPRETRAHVSRILAISAIVADPVRYGVDLEPIPDRVQFRQIALDGQIELDLAAKLAGITLDEIYLLNPGFNRWATDPAGPHRLLLPQNAAEQFKSRLAAIPGRTRVQWTHHSIVSGDTLGSIAVRYGTSVSVLMRLNGLTSDRILAGGHLRVPAPMQAVAETRLTGATAARLRGASLPSSLKSFHTVRHGDSLWRISRLHGVSLRQLAAWNNLPVNSVLRPGQRLAVYRYGARNGSSRSKHTGHESSETDLIFRDTCGQARGHALRYRTTTWDDGTQSRGIQPHWGERRYSAGPEAEAHPRLVVDHAIDRA